MNDRGSQTLGLHFSLICLTQKYIIYQAGIFNNLTIDYFQIISKQWWLRAQIKRFKMQLLFGNMSLTLSNACMLLHHGPHVAYVISHTLWKLTFGDKIRSSTMSKRCLQSTHLFWCSYTIPNKRMLMVKNKTRYSMIHEPHTAIDLKPARQRPVIRKRRYNCTSMQLTRFAANSLISYLLRTILSADSDAGVRTAASLHPAAPGRPAQAN